MHRIIAAALAVSSCVGAQVLAQDTTTRPMPAGPVLTLDQAVEAAWGRHHRHKRPMPASSSLGPYAPL